MQTAAHVTELQNALWEIRTGLCQDMDEQDNEADVVVGRGGPVEGGGSLVVTLLVLAFLQTQQVLNVLQDADTLVDIAENQPLCRGNKLGKFLLTCRIH